MKKIIVITAWAVLLLAVSALIFSIAGCRTVKQTTTSAVTVTDTSHHEVKVATNKNESFFHEKIVHDTVIGIGGNEITITSDKGDTTVRKGNVRLSIRGKVIDCGADSLTLVLTRLVKDSVNQSRQTDSLYSENQQQYYALQDYKFKSIERTEPTWRIWLNYLLAAIVGAMVWEIVMKVYKIVKAV